MKNCISNQLDKDKIRQRLKELRTTYKNKGLTQQQLADKLHIEKDTVSSWERKQNNIPGTDKLYMLYQLYGVSIDYLLGVSDYPSIKDAVIKKENKNITDLTGLTPVAVDTLRYCNECIVNGKDITENTDKPMDSPYNPNIIKLLNTLLVVDRPYSKKPFFVEELNTTIKYKKDKISGHKVKQIYLNDKLNKPMEFLNRIYDYLFSYKKVLVDKDNKLIENKKVFISDNLGRANTNIYSMDIDAINIFSIQKYLEWLREDIKEQQGTPSLDELLEKLVFAKRYNQHTNYNAIANRIRVYYATDILNNKHTWNSKYNKAVETLRQEFFESVTGSKAPLFPVMI